MLFNQDRNQMRQVFFSAWQKFRQQQPLDGVENLIVNALSLHPEYHSFFDDIENNIDKDFSPDLAQSNPFLHLGMHISIEEQLSIDQPEGIKKAYQQLLNKHQDPHKIQHLMMECLGKVILEAQQANTIPDNSNYLNCIQAID
jgi:hypothetical protein